MCRPLITTLALIIAGNIFSINSATAVNNAALSAKKTPLQDVFEQLNHEDYFVREKAAEQLRVAGKDALPWLDAGLCSHNPELEWRCAKLLESLALEGDDTTFEMVQSLLKKPADAQHANWQKLAADLQKRKITYRHDSAVARLQALGADVVSPREIELAEAELMEFDPFMEIDFVEPAADPFAEIAIGGIDIDGGDVEFGPAEIPFELGRILEAVRGHVAPEPMGILPGPVAGRDIAELTPPLLEPAFDDAAPPQPVASDLTTKIAEAVLPGEVGAALRKAFGLVPNRPQLIDPADLAMPELADEALEEGVAFEEFAIPLGGPIDLRHIDDSADIAAPRGSMQLTPEWRGGDEALAVLQDLQQVEILHIDHAKLTDAALPHIARMGELQHLQLHGTPFSREALLKFHREHAHVSIMALGEAMLGVNCDFKQTPCTLITVSPNTAAAAAGLEPGDVIQKLNDAEIRDFSELTIHIYTHKPGDELRVVYQRHGETREAKVKLRPRG